MKNITKTHKTGYSLCGSRLKNSKMFILYIFPDYSLVVTNHTTRNEVLEELSSAKMTIYIFHKNIEVDTQIFCWLAFDMFL